MELKELAPDHWNPPYFTRMSYRGFIFLSSAKKCEEGQCGSGEGDCDDDSHCKDGLKCGRNNCEGLGFGPNDDCCYNPLNGETACGNKSFPKCCTEENPCDDGEGDCQDDTHCAGNFVCGKNNCDRALGYSEKDDCCEGTWNLFLLIFLLFFTL